MGLFIVLLALIFILCVIINEKQKKSDEQYREYLEKLESEE